MGKIIVLYKDAHILVVDKPSGLLSVPGRGPEKSDCVVARAAVEYGWVREVHRLDQATSGILLLARTPDAHRSLSKSFAAREVEKTYIALTGSLPEDPHLDGVVFTRGNPGRIKLYQRLDTENRPHQIIDPQKGKEAITDWRVISSSDFVGGELLKRLELKPYTGRTHQLRLALSTCGAAIPGDTLYASREISASSLRLLLHAAVLRFTHPVSRKEMEINAVIPF